MKAFECKLCGECCYGDGGIIVNEEEINKIASFLQIQKESFVSDYCQKKNDKISIKSGSDKCCIFFDKSKGCIIHSVKPAVCSLWPFYPANITDKDTWIIAKRACPGINPACTFEEFVEESRGYIIRQDNKIKMKY
jgi:Fe-S-cluster containining protein